MIAVSFTLLLASLVLHPFIPSPPHPSFFFFNHPPTTAIYTLSLHDALPISRRTPRPTRCRRRSGRPSPSRARLEEHTSELQSRGHLVCRLLLEKKKIQKFT